MSETEKIVGRFSKYAVLVPVVHHFALTPTLWWKIKPATSRHELMMVQFTQTADANGNYPNIVQVAWREIATLFGGSNIPTSEISEADLSNCKTQEDADKLIESLPVLSADASIEQIESLLADMPHEMVAEIWKALGDCTPGWGPRKEKKVTK